jgi:outer membrane protein OmpA-like peptidoglycan-associated protein
MRILPALLVTGALTGFGTAAMAETDGWYLGAEAGVNIVPRIRFDANAQTWRQNQDIGYGVLGQVGYGFGQIRLEGEIGWRQNGVNRFNNAAGDQSPKGNIGGFSVMGNGYYDFNTGSKITPYLGVGLGGLNVSADHLDAAGIGVTNGSDFVFAYQGIAGLSYAINDGLAIKADYRYLRSEKANLALESSYGSGDGSGPYASHAILVGFTLKFPPPPPTAAAAAAAPPPPPPPAPPPAPAPRTVQAAPIPKNFMVFFDFDKDVLTPEAKTIITQAADTAKKNHSATIALTGYTDLAGTVAYNLKLSVRRGDSVKKLLVQLGIPADQISVVGKGKSDPLVPTKDGVREAQNRRVTIVLP